MSLLCAEDVSKCFATPDGPIWALQEFSLDVAAGTRWAIIGPNGAGKSTFLRVVAGIIAPTTGEVRRTKRCAALIDLGMGFHPDLTGRENLDLGLTLAGLGRAERRRLRDQVVDFAGLTRSLDQPLKHYSTGMVARLACAVAVHTRPELLLVDEVLAVGDNAFQRQMLTAIDHLVREGAALVLVTHSPELAAATTDRAIWINGGSETLRGPVVQVLEAYEVESRGLAATARDVPVRIERLVVQSEPRAPGGSARILVELRSRGEVADVGIRVELRPTVGSDNSWMRQADEPRAHRLLNLLATTAVHPVGTLVAGRYALVVEIKRIPVTSTTLELTAVITHSARGIIDEVSTDIRIGSVAPARPSYLLEVTHQRPQRERRIGEYE